MRGEIGREVGRVANFHQCLRQNRHGFRPQALEFLRGEHHIVVIVEQDVELVIAYLARAQPGSGEVRRTGNHRTWFVFVESLRAENIELGVESLGRVCFQFNSFSEHVLNELHDTGLDLTRISGGLDVFAQLGLKLLQRLRRVSKEQQPALVVVGHDGVHVDADENANLWNLFQIRADSEITRGSQVANHGVKPLQVGIALKYALELPE